MAPPSQIPPRKHPAPTAVQRAIQEGYQARAVTIGGSVVVSEIDDEPSVPHDLPHHDAIVYRLQKLEANDVELARGLGDVRTTVAVVEQRMDSLVEYAAKADARAERADQAKIEDARAERAARTAAEAQVTAAQLAARTAEMTAKVADGAGTLDLAKAKITSREKILLAMIGVISVGVAGYFAVSHLAIK
jgi:hypothetical protein